MKRHFFLRRSRTFARTAGLAAAGFFASCADSGEDAAPSLVTLQHRESEATFSEMFEVVRELSLEETDDAIFVRPFASMTDEGQIVATDLAGSFVGLYSLDDGSLIRLVATAGEGPGEVMMPLSAKERDGRIWVVGAARTVTAFSTRGEEAERHVVPMAMTLSATPLEDGRILFVGPADISDPEMPWLHRWREGETELESFFPLPIEDAGIDLAMSFPAMAVAFDDDHFWASWSLSSSLYRINAASGETTAQVPLSFSVPVTSVGDLARADAMPASVAMMSEIFVLADGRLAAELSIDGAESTELIIVDLEEKLNTRIADAPRLVMTYKGALYFEKPGTLFPHEWVEAVFAR